MKYKDYKILAKVTPDASYTVSMEQDIFDTDNPLIAGKTGSEKVLFVIDRGIGEKAIEKIKTYAAGFSMDAAFLVLKGGEDVKLGWDNVYRVVDKAEDHGLDRKSLMVLVGGGSVLDMAGFTASILHRGIRHIRVPTTLLSQTDAGIGTKNGINFRGQKNLLGVFNTPEAVFIDPSFLHTLDQRQISSGLAEIIKVALIQNSELFRWVERHYQDFLAQEFENNEMVTRIIWQGVLEHIKQINTDPYETEQGRPLDFGHQWGHRLEIITGHAMNHGEAVAAGMAIDCIISHKRNLLSSTDLESILSLLKAVKLPLVYESAAAAELWPGLEDFRRHLGGELAITLLKGIGKKIDVNTLLIEELEYALAYVKEQVQ
jgi:3-dehydroquinate synthase